MVSSSGGISTSGRAELTRVLETAGRFVTPEDVVNVLTVADRLVAAQKLARWAQEGWLRRVRRGLYIPVPVDADPALWAEEAMAVATELWSPCYFTGWTAANQWGLSEQVFRTTILKTGTRVRASNVRLLDHEYILSHISESEMSWGIDTVWHQDIRIRIADPARTVVDILDDPRLGGGIRNVAEVVDAYLIDHDADQLVEYGDQLGNRAVFKRLGYLVETLGLQQDRLMEACRTRVSSGISLLDPHAPDTGTRSMRWGLRINVRVDRMDPT